jgi:hypothetical protein
VTIRRKPTWHFVACPGASARNTQLPPGLTGRILTHVPRRAKTSLRTLVRWIGLHVRNLSQPGDKSSCFPGLANTLPAVELHPEEWDLGYQWYLDHLAAPENERLPILTKTNTDARQSSYRLTEEERKERTERERTAGGDSRASKRGRSEEAAGAQDPVAPHIADQGVFQEEDDDEEEIADRTPPVPDEPPPGEWRPSLRAPIAASAGAASSSSTVLHGAMNEPLPQASRDAPMPDRSDGSADGAVLHGAGPGPSAVQQAGVAAEPPPPRHRKFPAFAPPPPPAWAGGAPPGWKGADAPEIPPGKGRLPPAPPNPNEQQWSSWDRAEWWQGRADQPYSREDWSWGSRSWQNWEQRGGDRKGKGKSKKGAQPPWWQWREDPWNRFPRKGAWQGRRPAASPAVDLRSQ